MCSDDRWAALAEIAGDPAVFSQQTVIISTAPASVKFDSASQIHHLNRTDDPIP